MLLLRPSKDLAFAGQSSGGALRPLLSATRTRATRTRHSRLAGVRQRPACFYRRFDLVSVNLDLALVIQLFLSRRQIGRKEIVSLFLQYSLLNRLTFFLKRFAHIGIFAAENRRDHENVVVGFDRLFGNLAD